LAPENKYGVHARLGLLENAVTELRAENANLRIHLAAALETAIHDAKHIIQSSIRIPQDGVDGKPGRDGVDGAHGAQGIQGARGDCLIPNSGEIAVALLALRKKDAAWLAALQKAHEMNGQRKHSGLKAAINAVLHTIESEAR
jgi:hypothetical protein